MARDPLPALDTNYDEIVAIRRDIHAHPELAFKESRTAAVVEKALRSWNIKVHAGLGKTGVVGILRKGNSKRAIMLRADMDALPIQEENSFDHRSQHAQTMHACGHDGHTAILLGAARELAQLESFDGTVYFLFQPAEENGNAGAKAMINDGLFEKFPVDAIYGMHNWPDLPVGKFGVVPGKMMAGAAKFKVTINGAGGHAALPHIARDPVPPMIALAQAIQTVLTRDLRPLDCAVISITQVAAGGAAHNIIPATASLGGSIRAFEDGVFDTIEGRIQELAESIAKAHRCTAQVEITRSYPPLINSQLEFEAAVHSLRAIAGEPNVEVIEPVMGSEDFSYYLQKKPGCFVFIGNGDANGTGLGPCSLHNPNYDFNDLAIPVGVRYWCGLVESLLPKSPQETA
ncbi:M20 aminoacylase family protein [Pseudorhodoferax soli]|uniref:Hippurate hydrolase n=1 Tax=Pseudorhodoferax soli TaxID=545864 RepID=A0A368XL88_9BURK|nr:M20 aminoacylase family protein [Pseudorhodoferax soli]RCW68680.1 hippurate hydrolase [Pseudorhodoferax soli]